MLIAVIADIHSNSTALEKVLDEIDKKNPSYIISPGDIVGYGPDPNGVCDRLREMDNFLSVRGNHDQAVIDGDITGMNPVASEAIKFTTKEISDENLKFLKHLDNYYPLKLDIFNIFLVHGSPDNYLDDYIYPDTSENRFKKFFDKTRANLIVNGHSHIPFTRQLGDRVFLNAGSVGQPRDRDPRACYVLIDTENHKIEVKRTEYDIDKVSEKMKRKGLPKTLADRLYYGW